MDLQAKYSMRIVQHSDHVDYLVGVFEPEPVLIHFTVPMFMLKSLGDDKAINDLVLQRVCHGWAKRFMDDVIMGHKSSNFLTVQRVDFLKLSEDEEFDLFQEWHRKTPSHAVEV